MLVYLNGRILPRGEARIDPFDRGFLFGDGIYEGLRAFDGRIVGLDLHVRRMRDGLGEAGIPWDAAGLGGVCDAVLGATGLRDAFVYLQVTRGGPAPGEPVRARVLTGEVRPTVFAYAAPVAGLAAYPPVPTKRAVTLPDQRWLRGRVKSISLMGGVLAAIESGAMGADDAILVRDTPRGLLAAESTSANLIVALPRSGGTEIVTPPLDGAPILAGVTRDLILSHAAGAGVAIVERDVPREELLAAREVMLCGTLTMVTAITHLDGRAVGGGTAGPAAHALLEVLRGAIRGEHAAGREHLARAAAGR